MVKEITKDTDVLQTKSKTATKMDMHIIQDILDTAQAHEERCCGLAAIQISEAKRIIVAKIGDGFRALINPLILWRSSETYIAEEGCMSLDGKRTVTRHEKIKVVYEYPLGKKHVVMCSGFVSEIIQHEVDHCNGKLI